MAEEQNWDEVLITNNPESKEIEVSFKRIDGDGFIGDNGGTPPGTIEDPNGCTNTIGLVSDDVWLLQSGAPHWIWITLRSVPTEEYTVTITFTDGTLLFPEYGTQSIEWLISPGSFEANEEGVTGIKVPLTLGDVSRLTDVGTDSASYNAAITAVSGTAVDCWQSSPVTLDFGPTPAEVPPEDPAAGGDPIPGDNPECGDKSCASWSAYEAGGWDGTGGWAGKVAKLYKTETDYNVNGNELLVTGKAGGNTKAWMNLFGTPSDFYAVNSLNVGRNVPTEGYDTINYATTDVVSPSDFIESRVLDPTSGGLCEKIYISKSSWTASRGDLDFGLDNAGNYANTNRNYGPSNFVDVGYGFIGGIQNFLGTYDGTATEQDIPNYPFPGSLSVPVLNQTFFWVRKCYSFFVGGVEVGGDMLEPSNATIDPVTNNVSGTPISLPTGLFRMGYVTYDERRDDYVVSSLDSGNATVEIYDDKICIRAASSSNPDANLWYQRTFDNPDTDGTSRGWYTLEVNAKYEVSGPYVPANTFYETEWRLKDVSTVKVYKNGRLLLGEFPCGKDAIDHFEDATFFTSNKYTEQLDKNRYGFFGYRNDDTAFTTSTLNPGIAMNWVKPRSDASDATYLLYYEGPDALELPQSDFGQRFLRQFEDFIVPGYCNRIP